MNYLGPTGESFQWNGPVDKHGPYTVDEYGTKHYVFKRPTYEELEARLAAVVALCDTSIREAYAYDVPDRHWQQRLMERVRAAATGDVK